MAGADLLALRGVPHFDPTGDASTVSVKWKSWLEEFDAYADSRGLFLEGSTAEGKAQRRALLLFSAGPTVRETFKTFPETGKKEDYQKAVDALNAHYVVKPNATFQRHLFRKTRQEDGETVAQYVTRLRQASVGCNYVTADLDNQILDQVVQYCKSDKLRRRLLERGGELKLSDALSIAVALETVEGQFDTMTLKDNSNQPKFGQVNRLSHTSSYGKPRNMPAQEYDHDYECYRCGNKGHFGKDPCCPARGRTCAKCGGKDHFARKCKSKLKPGDNVNQNNTTSFKGNAGEKGKSSNQKNRFGQERRGNIRHVEGDSESDDDGQSEQKNYQFVLNDTHHEKVPVVIGGVTVPVIVDSGSDSNVIDRELWEHLKQKKIKCTSKKCSRKLYPYTATKPLQTIGCFTATVEAGDKTVKAEFVVIEEKGEPLLSRSTAQELAFLHIGAHINSVQSYDNMKQEIPTVFHGVGKSEGRQVKLAVDETVKPKAQPARRTPFGLRGKVETKIKEFIDQDIIEPVEQSTPGAVTTKEVDRESEDDPEPIRSTKLPTGPWVDVAVDVLGPLPTGESILVVVDYYSRYHEYAVMKSTTAERTVQALAEIFARHGLPVTLYSDNGPQFISETFAQYMRAMGIHHHKETPKWPQANGEVERQNQSIEKRIRIAHAEGKNWREALLTYVAVYRATPHATTGKSPAEALFGRKIRTKMPELREITEDQEMRDRDAEKKGAAKLYADLKRGARYSEIMPGDHVLLRREHGGKLDTPYYNQPYTVVSRSGSMVTVRSPAGAVYKRNVSGVKKYMYLSRDAHSEVAQNASRATYPQGPDDIPEVQVNIPDDVAMDPESSCGTPNGNGDTEVDLPDSDAIAGRPSRERRPPKRYDDFLCYS